MISQLQNLSNYQKQALLQQARQALDSWEEQGNPELVWNGYYYECNLNNEDESVLVLYKCECGALIAEYDDYSGILEEAMHCPKCGRHYEE